jgi:hypothetical protein
METKMNVIDLTAPSPEKFRTIADSVSAAFLVVASQFPAQAIAAALAPSPAEAQRRAA